MTSGPRLRFAPSPTGSLHLGNARTALFNWLVARRRGGRLVLRIEDTDVEREVAGAEASILDDLRWLGLDWDEGPDCGGPRGPYRQSERGELYRRAAGRLIGAGQAYRCFCVMPADGRAQRATRGQRPSPAAGPGCSCAALDPEAASARARAGEPAAVRFDPARNRAGGMPPPRTIVVHDRLRGPVEFGVDELGQPVILRRDGRATYNFAVVVDDATMGIDLVIRGDDHLSNAPLQVALHRALGGEPPELAHVPMVRGADGGRLSKRHGAVSVAEYRRAGYPAEALVNALALLGWAPAGGERTVIGRDDLVAEFDLDRVGRSPAIFDPAKLDWISAQHLREWPAARLGREVVVRLVAAGRLPAGADGDGAWVQALGELVHGDVDRLDRAAARCEGLFWTGGRPGDDDARQALEGPGGRDVAEALARLAAGRPVADAAGWRELAAAVRDASGQRGRGLYRPLRVVVTGRAAGPELDRLVPLIEAGARRFPSAVVGLAERARRTAEALG